MVPRKALPMAKLVGLNNRHRHLLIWRKLWPCKPNYYVNGCRDNKISHAPSKEDVMIMFLRHPGIRISLVPSSHCSTRLTSPWMQMHGFGPYNRSSPYCQCHVPKQTRPSSLLSSYMALHASGGIIIVPCCPPTISSLGKNFGPPLGCIIFPRDFWSVN